MRLISGVATFVWEKSAWEFLNSTLFCFFFLFWFSWIYRFPPHNFDISIKIDHNSRLILESICSKVLHMIPHNKFLFIKKKNKKLDWKRNEVEPNSPHIYFTIFVHPKRPVFLFQSHEPLVHLFSVDAVICPFRPAYHECVYCCIRGCNMRNHHLWISEATCFMLARRQEIDYPV